MTPFGNPLTPESPTTSRKPIIWANIHKPPIGFPTLSAKSGTEGEGEWECRGPDRAWKGERSGGEQQQAAETVLRNTTIGGGILDLGRKRPENHSKSAAGL